MTIPSVDIDLSKNEYAVHGVNEAGKPGLVPRACRVRSCMLGVVSPPLKAEAAKESLIGGRHWGCHSKCCSPRLKMPTPDAWRGKRNMISPFGAATVLSPPSTLSSGRLSAFGQFV